MIRLEIDVDPRSLFALSPAAGEGGVREFG